MRCDFCIFKFMLLKHDIKPNNTTSLKQMGTRPICSFLKFSNVLNNPLFIYLQMPWKKAAKTLSWSTEQKKICGKEFLQNEHKLRPPPCLLPLELVMLFYIINCSYEWSLCEYFYVELSLQVHVFLHVGTCGSLRTTSEIQNYRNSV